MIDKGTENQYTSVVAFDASASSSGDWDAILAEITARAEDIKDVDLIGLGAGKAVRVQGSAYSGTMLRDIQTIKACGSLTNQTEWSRYSKAINRRMLKVLADTGHGDLIVIADHFYPPTRNRPTR